jgi:hypothetical protein
MIPDRTSIRSNSGQERMNSLDALFEQNPMTRSTPARFSCGAFALVLEAPPDFPVGCFGFLLSWR